jgi:hypothetical protein
MGTGVLSQQVKRLGHKLNHSPPSSAEVKNEWSYTSTHPICLHGKDKENLTFTMIIPPNVSLNICSAII